MPYAVIELAVHLSSIYISRFIFLSQDILQTRFPMPRYIVTEQGGSQVNTRIMYTCSYMKRCGRFELHVYSCWTFRPTLALLPIQFSYKYTGHSLDLSYNSCITGRFHTTSYIYSKQHIHKGFNDQFVCHALQIDFNLFVVFGCIYSFFSL